MRLAVFRQLLEDKLRVFQKDRHVLARMLQRGKEVVPMYRNHQFCSRLFHRLREEGFFRIGICFCEACYAEKYHVGMDAVQLTFDLVETGTNQDFPFSVFYIEVVGSALFIISRSGRLYQGRGDRLPEIIIENSWFRVQ